VLLLLFQQRLGHKEEGQRQRLRRLVDVSGDGSCVRGSVTLPAFRRCQALFFTVVIFGVLPQRIKLAEHFCLILRLSSNMGARLDQNGDSEKNGYVLYRRY